MSLRNATLQACQIPAEAEKLFDEFREVSRRAQIELRPYQQNDVGNIRAAFARGSRSVCYQLATGGGKTVVFVYIIAAAVAKGSRVLVLAHRVEILDQICMALEQAGVPYGIIAAGYPEDLGKPVQVASVLTAVLRLDRIAPPDLIVVDETHHVVASSWRRILDALPGARILGTTATPLRLDGAGLGDVFEVMVTGPSVRELINAGYLANFVAFGPKVGPDLNGVGVTAGDFRSNQLADVMSNAVVIGSAVSEYAKICPGVPSIAFCVDREHSRKVVQAFIGAGWRAAHVDGTTRRDERRGLIASLAAGELDVLSNCDLISEGLDVPGVGAAILLRPTMSLALYLQQVGRCLRPGKPKAFILDHAGNTIRHGLPDDPRQWSLTGKVSGEMSAAAPRQCEACGAFNRPGATHCAGCGAALAVARPREESEPRLHTERESVLEAIEIGDLEWLAGVDFNTAAAWAGHDRQRLHRMARARGYKRGWVHYRMQEPLHGQGREPGKGFAHVD
jgi:DNA repair protein RadD